MRRLLLIGLLAACAGQSQAVKDDAPAFGVVIEGNDKVSVLALRGAARREIADFLEKGHRQADAADAADSMRALLWEKGHAHGEVIFEVREDALRFTVHEGSLVLLGPVGFDGTRSFAERDLAEFFAFPGPQLLGGGQPVFVQDEVEGAAAKLERYYLLHGFYRVKVHTPVVTWSEDRSVASVTIRVDEGRRYTISKIVFHGAPPVDVGLQDAPFNARIAVEAASKLKGMLFKKGHQFARVDHEVAIDDETATVAVEFDIDPGPEVRLGKIRFDGHERTKEWFLKRRIPLEESDLIVQDLYNEGVANLYRTGLFSSVRARLNQVDESTADLDIALKELKARSVDFEVGYGSYELLRGAVRYRNRNLFGTGRRFLAEVTGSVRGAGFEVSLVDPYLLGERMPVEISGGFGFREEPSFDRRAIETAVTVSREVRGLDLRFGYKFRSEEALNATVPVDPEAEGFIRTAGLFFTIRKDHRDSFIDPSKGWVAQLGLGWSSELLGADLNFLEYDVRYAHYFRLVQQIVLATGIRFRTRQILDDRSILPIQDRFFLGGPSDVRSFGQSELGPTVNGEPFGGLTSLNGTIEFRRQIVGGFHGGIFFDFGILDVKAWSLGSPLGYGVGAGLRYMLPVGPIRIDFAYNPGPLFAATRRWQVHFAFGFTF